MCESAFLVGMGHGDLFERAGCMCWLFLITLTNANRISNVNEFML